jgi:hypothetical protein
MSDRIERFLGRKAVVASHRSLGRVFGVTRQSWPLSADPRKTKPQTLVLATQRSASDAADLARDAAAAFAQSGFHKPSGAWWAAEDETFHRFLVGPRSQRTGLLLLGAGLASIAAVAFIGAKRKTADPE